MLTDLNLYGIIGAGGLGSLDTLAKLREFLILPAKQRADRSLCSAFFLKVACLAPTALKSWQQQQRCLYRRCKSNCSCSSWFSRVWAQIAESWFWIFCFSSLTSSFKALTVWGQKTEGSVRRETCCGGQTRLWLVTWLAELSLSSRSSSFLFRASRFFRIAQFASTFSDRVLSISDSFSSNFFIRASRSWLRSSSCCNTMARSGF